MSEVDAKAAEDIFSRPSEFRQSAVLAIWENAKPVRGKPDHRYDWRNGTVVGPWKEGESRDGVWDMGHKEAWYKVVERLKLVDGITREDVLDEFNNLDNIGVEDPVANRNLGSNSRTRGVARLPYEEEEETLFEDVHTDEKEPLRQQFRAQIDEQEHGVKQRLQQYSMKGDPMSDEKQKGSNQPERVIIWDTETTGLSHRNGDKLVEIGAVEMIDGKVTGNEFHVYINPERDIPPAATKVHGITNEDVKDAPIFKDVAQDFLDFVDGAPLVAHNATFDLGFVNAELEAVDMKPIEKARSIDTLRLSRKVLPDLEKHTLDTLAEHFDVDTSGRDEHHGGLIDTIILADVYKGLADLAKEQDIDILPRTEAARMAPGAEAREWDKAVADEMMLKPQWGEQSKGFADRVRDEDAQGKSAGGPAR